MTRLLAAALAVSLVAGAASAQSAPPSVPRPDSVAQPPSPTMQVFLVTMGEGAYYWEKFGHNALWFHDPGRGVDVAYNWGTFDFDEPGYLGRLLIGDTRYWVEAVPGPVLMDFYRQYDRTVIVQRLDLTAAQAARAYQYSQWNARDENKYYQYDYFRDNCSTRVRDVIDLALGGALQRVTSVQRTGHTYRSESLRLVDDMKLVQLGINAALGRPSDARLSVWEDMFVPSRLHDALATLTLPGPDGSAMRVVAEERVLYQSRSHGERSSTPSLVVPYLIAGLLLAALLVLVARLGERSPAFDVIFRIEATVWATITGILGLVILLAWLITQHVFWFRNENLLLLNPLAIFLALLIPLARRPRWRRPAAICAIVIAMLAALALVVKGLPGSTQQNLAMIFLLLPPHFAIAYGLWRRAQPLTAAATVPAT